MSEYTYAQIVAHDSQVIKRASKQLRYTVCGALVWLGVALWVVWRLLEVLF